MAPSESTVTMISVIDGATTSDASDAGVTIESPRMACLSRLNGGADFDAVDRAAKGEGSVSANIWRRNVSFVLFFGAIGLGVVVEIFVDTGGAGIRTGGSTQFADGVAC